MRIFRVLLGLLILILLLPVWPLLSRTSSTADTILGRYTLRYFALLAAYGAMLAGLLAAAILARPAWRDLVVRPIRLVQRFPVVLVATAIFLLWAWYPIREVLGRTIYFGTIGSPTYRLMLIFCGLLFAYVLVVLVFGGREPGELRTVAGNVGALAFGLALAFVAFSYAYALILRRDVYLQDHTIWGATRNDRVLGTMTRSNLDGYGFYLASEQRTIPVSTNAEGFRSPDPGIERPLAVIGDSFAFGLFSSDDELWTNKLSDLLELPVANYGIWGIDFERYNLVAETYIEPGEHDLVMYAIYANDLRVTEVPGAPLDLHRLRASRRFSGSPISYTYAQMFVVRSPFDLLTASRPDGTPEPESAHGYTGACFTPSTAEGYSDRARELVEQHLDRTFALAEAGDYDLLFVLIPSRVAVYAEELLPICGPYYEELVALEEAGFEALCAYVTERGYDCYDTTADFRQAADRAEPLFLSVDVHWNALGNEVFARLVADYIEANNLLP